MNQYKSKIMKRLTLLLCVLVTLLSTFSSCNKDAGEGGNAIIEGTVMQIIHTDDCAMTVDTIPAAKTDVFIVYGNDEIYGDDMETNPNGQYRFKYLKSGKYTVFAYSVLPSGEKVAVSTTVEVKPGQTVKAPTLYIHSGKAYGTSVIKGQVWAEFYKKGEHLSSGWAYEHRVYIREINQLYHFDDVRVGHDGYYYFQKLQPGTYEVYTVTENMDEVPSLLRKQVVVTESGRVYDAGTFSVVINV